VTIKNVCVLMALTLLAIGGVACGDSNDESATVSKPQFVAQGNSICWETLKTQEAAFQEILNQGIEEEATKFDPAKQKAFIQEVASSTRKMVDELSALGAPSGDEAEVERILAEYEDGIAKAEAKPQALLSGEAFEDADAAAKAYGLKKCTL
jgi:hypothetical protein